MQHAVLKSLAAAGTLALAIAACSSSGTQSGSGNAASSTQQRVRNDDGNNERRWERGRIGLLCKLETRIC